MVSALFLSYSRKKHCILFVNSLFVSVLFGFHFNANDINIRKLQKDRFETWTF